MSVVNIGPGSKVCCGGATGWVAVGEELPAVRCVVAYLDVRTSHSKETHVTRV